MGGRIPLTRYVAFLHRALLEGKHRLAGDPIEHVQNALLGWQCHALDGTTTHRDVGEDGRGGKIKVPDRMPHNLVVPLPHSGAQVHTHQTLTIQIVSRSVPAVVVAGWRFHRQIHQAEFFINRDLCPHTGITGLVGGTIQPRVVAELALAWNGVKGPQPFSGAHVESTNVALVVAKRFRRTTLAERGADNHHIAANHRSALVSDFPGHQVRKNGLVRLAFEIHGPAVTEAENARAGARIERHQSISRCGIQDARTLSVGPIRQSATRQWSRRGGPAFPFVLAVQPQQFAGGRVERDNSTPRAGGGVQHAAHHERCPFQLEFGTRSQLIGLESPCNFEGAEIGSRNLVEWCVARPARVTRVAGPFAGCRRE